MRTNGISDEYIINSIYSPSNFIDRYEIRRRDTYELVSTLEFDVRETMNNVEQAVLLDPKERYKEAVKAFEKVTNRRVLTELF